MLAVQYLMEPDYTCLVTRRNYAELLDTNSIWENLIEWCCSEDLPENIRCKAYKTPAPKIVAPNGNTLFTTPLAQLFMNKVILSGVFKIFSLILVKPDK